MHIKRLVFISMVASAAISFAQQSGPGGVPGAGASTGFPITLGSTSIAASSTTTALAGLSTLATTGNVTVGGTLLLTNQLGGSTIGTAVTIEGGQNGSSGSAVGGLLLQGGNNSGAGAAGLAILQGGQGTGGGAQGYAYVNQSFTVAAALGATFEVVSTTTTGNQVQASPLGTIANVGIARTIGGTGTAILVTTAGQTQVRFDGTPVIGDIACAPPTSSGTIGLAHDNGASACPAGQKLGLVMSTVSGTGSGATAIVLLQLGS